MNKTTDSILDIMSNTVFLAKNLDDFEQLIDNNIIDQQNIIASRTTLDVFKKFKNVYVHDMHKLKREYSTSIFFREQVFKENIFANHIKKKNVWAFRSYEWLDDLKAFGKNIFAIEYYLNVLLTNKITQLDLLQQSNIVLLKEHIESRNKILLTNKVYKNENAYHSLNDKYGEFVISCRISDGGNGVYKISSENDYEKIIKNIKNPIIRVDKYLKDCYSFNQTAIILNDANIIKYQPSLQIIIELQNQLSYQGSSFKIDDILPNDIKQEMTRLTHFIGVFLSAKGYKGIFGCDYLYCPKKDGMKLFFIEINPRYQASTSLLANTDISNYSDNTNLLLNPHIAHSISYCSFDKNLYQDFSKVDTCIDLIDNTYHSIIELKYNRQLRNLYKGLNQYKVKLAAEEVVADKGVPYGFLLARNQESFFDLSNFPNLKNDVLSLIV